MPHLNPAKRPEATTVSTSAEPHQGEDTHRVLIHNLDPDTTVDDLLVRPDLKPQEWVVIEEDWLLKSVSAVGLLELNGSDNAGSFELCLRDADEAEALIAAYNGLDCDGRRIRLEGASSRSNLKESKTAEEALKDNGKESPTLLQGSLSSTGRGRGRRRGSRGRGFENVRGRMATGNRGGKGGRTKITNTTPLSLVQGSAVTKKLDWHGKPLWELRPPARLLFKTPPAAIDPCLIDLTSETPSAKINGEDNENREEVPNVSMGSSQAPPADSDVGSEVERIQPKSVVHSSRTESAEPDSSGVKSASTVDTSAHLPLDFVPGPAVKKETLLETSNRLKPTTAPFVTVPHNPVQSKAGSLMTLTNGCWVPPEVAHTFSWISQNRYAWRQGSLPPLSPYPTFASPGSSYSRNEPAKVHHRSSDAESILSPGVAASLGEASLRATATTYSAGVIIQNQTGSDNSTAVRYPSIRPRFRAEASTFVPSTTYQCGPTASFCHPPLMPFTPIGVDFSPLGGSSKKSWRPFPAYVPPSFVHLLHEAGMLTVEDVKETLSTISEVFAFVKKLGERRPDALHCFVMEFALASKLCKILGLSPFNKIPALTLQKGQVANCLTEISAHLKPNASSVLEWAGLNFAEEARELLTLPELVPIFVERLARRRPDALAALKDIVYMENKLNEVIGYEV